MKLRQPFLLIVLLLLRLNSSQAQYIFMPASQRLHVLDSLKQAIQTLQQQTASFKRDSLLFFALDRYHYHYFEINRPFSEKMQKMRLIPDSMYRIATRHKWPHGQVTAELRRADAISWLGDKAAAVQLYKGIIQRCKQQYFPHEHSLSLINLAVCFAYRLGISKADWQQALNYMHQARRIAQNTDDVENIHQYFNLMGDFQLIRQQYAQALPFYEAERPLMLKNQHLSGFRTNTAYLGICYLHTGQEAKAWRHLNLFFRLHKADEGTYATKLYYTVLHHIGAYYLRKKDFRNALKYQLPYGRIAKERPLFDRATHYQTLIEIYTGLKDYKRAFTSQQLYMVTRDSLKLEEASRKFADIENQLALEHKEKEIKNLQNKSLQQQVNSQRTFIFFLAIVFWLLVGILVLVNRSNQLKKQSAETELNLALAREEADHRLIQTQESERRRIAADLHDDLGGTLATIRRRIGNLRQYQNGTRIDQELEQLEPLIQKSADDLRRISHNLMPPEFTRIGLCGAIEQLVLAIPPQPTCFEFLVAGQQRSLPPEMELNLYRILSELIQNILKHAQAKRASLQFIYQPEQITVVVEDDGVGFQTPDTHANGIGLQNTDLRVAYMGATLHRESGKGGTFVMLEIPFRSEIGI